MHPIHAHASTRFAGLARWVGATLAVVLGAAAIAPAVAQQPAVVQQPAPQNRANWTLANRYSNPALSAVTYTSNLAPAWIARRDSLWYNWRDRNGTRFVLVVPKTKTKQPLFDHIKMATQLSSLHRKPYDPNNLPFTQLTFDSTGKSFRFNVDTGTLAQRYEWVMATETLRSLGRPSADSTAGGRGGRGGGGGDGGGRGGRGGGGGGGGGNQNFRNFSPDSSMFVFARDHNLYLVEVGKPDTIQLSKDGVRDYSFGFRDTTTTQQQQQQQRDTTDDQQDDNVQQQQLGGRGGQQQQQQQGGRGGRGGGRGGPQTPPDPRVRPSVNWSPDSKAFFIQRTDNRKVKELHLVDMLANPRPTLRSYRYAMPGEVDVPQQELFAFRKGDKEITRLPVGKWKDQRLVGQPQWVVNSDRLRMVRRDRLQRNMEFIEINPSTKEIKILVSESVENANIEPGTGTVRYVSSDTTNGRNRGGDFIWWSERTGWGHFYLYDNNGKLKNAITSGPWRAEALVGEVDTLKRVVYISGVGREEGENPYYSHLYRVNLDGTGITLLNPGNATHTSNANTLSPSKKYLVDVSSRTDLEPSAVLRDALTGAKIMDLETMDLVRLKEIGWKAPTTFSVKAADGVTDIYGNMWKPFDFDSTKKYPIIAHVYPGPQTESVTAGFSANANNQRLAQLGFIVIQIGNRGGSPQRSNAYQSFSYFNLRDYGLADKKAGIEQLAARHHWIDIDRVGIYGHSGGGFMTAAALLLPPYNDFFKVGVSSSGNHDNNVYNQNWSEQYHGLTEIITQSAVTTTNNGTRQGGPQTGQGQVQDSAAVAGGRADTTFRIRVPANHELAANLKGRLLLTHGDLDNNVHPAGTIRLANALIRANKRFDLFIFPGQPHSYGPMQGYFNTMMFEYFAEHLLGDYYRGNATMH